MSGCSGDLDAANAAERRTLVIVLAINAVMFVVEFTAGWLAHSTGLTADSLDMLADASVYASSLYALGRGPQIRGRIAYASGIVLMLLGAGVLLDVVRRFVFGSEPVSRVMMVVGTGALIANAVCLYLLADHREGSVNLRSSWIFSLNDVIANVGVVASGVLVWLTGLRWPDLIIGLVISAVVLRGGVKIVREARASLEDARSVG